MTVNPVDRSVLVDTTNGDLRQILAVPSDGKTPGRVLLTLTGQMFYMDMAADGSLYVDQVERPVETLRFGESARLPEAMAVVPVGDPSVLELPDSRFLLSAIFDGRWRLLVAKPSGELVPFVDTDEEARGPATFVGSDQVAFMLGKPPQQSIAIASIKDGRVLHRLKIAATDTVRSLSASSDASTIFYANGGSIWSIPIAGGDARKLGAGDAVAFDPSRQSLIVQLSEKNGVRLARMPPSGGPTDPIPIHSELRIPGQTLLGSNAVRMDGQIAISVASGTWFWGAGILDPATGNLRRVPLRYDGDILSLSWNQKNEMVTGGALMHSALWRFRLQSNR